MRRYIFVLVLMIMPLLAKAQSCGYLHVETTSSSQEEVTFVLKVFCDNKKTLDYEANIAALRCVMFDGIPDTRFSKPLLSGGEKTEMEKHQDYFENLYDSRWTDFVKSYKMISKFKKSGDKKSTLFEVTVKASLLRKDLEKNRIKNILGI